MDNKKRSIISIAVSGDEEELIREQADRERRPVSNLIKSIVLPEIERRRRENGQVLQPTA